MAKVVIIGPAHPLRGGLATFNHRLAKEFQEQGNECEIWNYSLQYPRIFFPGKSQYTDEPPPPGIKIRTTINSVNPLNWINTGESLRKLRPDIIVVRYWLPFMGPALGTILRRVKKNRHTKIICLADNVIPHEKRPGDKPFTKYFLQSCDGFITMSEKVMEDLKKFENAKPAIIVRHPLYDNFGDPLSKDEARKKLGLQQSGPVFLFFGFIRRYKGLDILLEAVKLLKEQNVDFKLVIAGEFYEDEKPYHELINRYDISERIILKTKFIPDREVKYYFSAADCVIQPYRQATQSGVTPLAYHFEKPMIVTDVGGLPSLVPHLKSGIVVNPDAVSMAQGIREFLQLGADYFIPHLRNEKKKYAWSHLVQAVLELKK